MQTGADLSVQSDSRNDELLETRRNLEAIYQASADGLALCEATFGPDGRVVEYQVLEVNRAHGELTGASREQMLSQAVSTIYPPIDPRWFDTATAVLKTGVMQHFDIRSRATGRWLNIRVSRVSERLFQQTFVDVSDRHIIEEQRLALLKEMSHRVMNNFQMIAGFLHIQAASVGAEAKAHLETAIRRVHVLANLHSLLAYTESDAEIDAASYVRQLCSHLASMIERPEAVVLVCEAGPLNLAADKVVLLGFIISELVTNSAKYAYPSPRTGVIRVCLQPDQQGWTLSISDEGQGLQTAAPKTRGLGTRLVDRFIAQLDAEMITTTGAGVRHQIRWSRKSEC